MALWQPPATAAGRAGLLLALTLGATLATCTGPALTPQPTPPPSRAPTLHSLTPQPTATPGGPAFRRPLPVIYKFFDVGTDFQTLHPEYGPIGSVHYVTWEEINPAPGRFDWGPIDRQLAREAALKVTLRDGRVVSKPVALEVALYRSQHPNQGNYFFYDCTPQWVYQAMGDRPAVDGRLAGHVVTCGTTQGVVPAYDSPAWQNAHAEMVRALGARYRDHPQIEAVFISTGIDEETQVIKNTRGCEWKEIVRQQARDLEPAFDRFVLDCMRLYREAFPTNPIYILNTPGRRRETSDFAASLVPPVGIKNCALEVDLDSLTGYGGFVGRFDPWETYSNTIPIWLETLYGLGNAETRYWAFIAGLHYHPDAIDVHAEFLTQSQPGWLAFVHDHLGRTIETTPDVWVVLRDFEFPKVMWGTSGQSGRMGDWDYWLYRLEGAPASRTVRVWRADLPAACQDQVYSRQARRTDQAHGQTFMSFNIDDRYPFVRARPDDPPERRPAYRVDLKVLNQGGDSLAREYKNWAGLPVRRTVRKGAELGPADRWVDLSFVLDDAYFANDLPGGADFRLSCEGDGDEVVHMVRVTGAWGAPPAPVPLP